MIKSYRGFRYVIIIGLVLLVTSCGGGDGSSGNSYPTPTLPAGARSITEANADDTAILASSFVTTLSEFAALKTENTPTMAQVVDRVVDQVIRRNRIARSENAFRTEDLSSFFCVSGSVIADTDETSTSESGTITFNNCDIGSGIYVNGAMAFDSTWDNTSLNYNLQLGGNLDFDFGTELVTIVMNLAESGNDGSGDYSTSISYSLAGIAGGGFLVTTTQNVVGNNLGPVSGELIVTGSANSRLRLSVIGPNSISVELDEGSGAFVSCALIAGCNSPVFF